MSKTIEFASEQIETEDIKKTVVITETTQVVKNTSVELLQQNIDEITNQIARLNARKTAYETERDEIKSTLGIS